MNNIKSERVKAGLTQAELAAKLNITQAQVSHMENGCNERISIDSLKKMKEIFGCSVEYMLGMTEERL